MQTNFFQQIVNLATSGKLLLTIQPLANKTMIVSVHVVNKELTDNSVNKIPPLILTGSPAELDEGFFPAIATPIQKTGELLTNLLEYQQSVERAKGESRIQKDKQEIGKKDQEGRRKKYDEQMKKVAELEGQNKFGQAIAQVPDPAQYPQFAEEIGRKLVALRANHGSLSLFGDEPELLPMQESNPPEAVLEKETDPFHAVDPQEENDPDEEDIELDPDQEDDIE